MIAEYFIVFEKMGDTLPILVFNSLEKKNDPCKSDSPKLYPFWKMRDILPFLVFNTLERKNDPCKSDGPTLYPLWKNAWIFTLFSV